MQAWNTGSQSAPSALELHKIGVGNGYRVVESEAEAMARTGESAVDQQPLLGSKGGHQGNDQEQSTQQLAHAEEGRKVAFQGDFQEEAGDVASAVFNLSTTIVGAGIMALPATMRVMGLPIGLALILVMGVLSEFSVEMVVRFTSKVNALTYEEAIGGVCGRVARVAAQICVLVNNGGILIVYLIIIADVLAGSTDHIGLFEQWVGGPGWWNNRTLSIFLTMLFVVAPLVSLEHISSLKYSSAVSIALALVFVILTTGVALVKLFMGQLESPRMLPDLSSKAAIFQIFAVIPIMTNAYICHFNVPPIYNELRNKNVTKMNRVGRMSLAFCTIVYAATALSGYLLFGQATADDILSNFDTNLDIPYNDFINYVIRVGYAVHIMLVFPLIFFALRLTIDPILFPNSRPLSESRVRFGLLSLGLLVIIFVGAALIPNIWVAFNFTGATTGQCLGFMLPALLVLMSKSRTESDSDRIQKIVAWVMLPVAIFVSAAGVTTQAVSYVGTLV